MHGSRLRCRAGWVNWFQAKLFSYGSFFGFPGLQGTEIKNQVPCLIRSEVVSKGWHRRAVQAGHKDFIKILICLPALEPMARCEVVRHDRPILAIGQSRG